MGNVGRALSLILLATGLAGCPCTDLADAEIQDPHDLATPEQEAEIRQAMDEFAAWTGVSELCVDAVRVRYIPVDDVEGVYFPDRDVIAIEANGLVDAEAVVRHELCHAWDWAMGHPSLDNRHLFRAESVPLDDEYPTADARVIEAFARACEEAPQPIDLRPGLEEACGFELQSEQQRWVMEYVFPHFEPDWKYAGAFEAGVSKVRTPWFLGPVWTISSDGNDHAYRYRLIGMRRSPPDRSLQPESEVSASTGLVDSNYEGQFEVTEADLRTGARISSRRFALPDAKDLSTALSYQQPSGSLLLAYSRHRTVGVHIEPDGGAVTEIEFPESMTFPFRGVSRGDRGWFAVYERGLDREMVAEVDLRTGAWKEIEFLQPGRTFDSWRSSLFDLGEEILIAHVPEDGATRLVSYDPDSGALRRERIEAGEPLPSFQMTTLDDGRWVITATLTLRKQTDDVPGDYRYLLILYDPDTGRYWIDPQTCEPEWYIAKGQEDPWFPPLMAVDNNVFYVTWSGPDSLELFRLDIPPREALLPRP
jgi:hypothetical protein